jgi:hypothetical protein
MLHPSTRIAPALGAVPDAIVVSASFTSYRLPTTRTWALYGTFSFDVDKELAALAAGYRPLRQATRR